MILYCKDVGIGCILVRIFFFFINEILFCFYFFWFDWVIIFFCSGFFLCEVF